MGQVYWVWFTLVFGIGTRRSAELTERVVPEELYGRSRAELRDRQLFTPAEIEKIQTIDLAQAQMIVTQTEKLGAHLLTPDDDEYPVRLANIYAMPAVLYVQGSLAGVDDELAIAMVGSRKITPYGKAAATTLTEGLAAAGTTIVSGMAVGVDQTCHKAALAAGVKTIGVLGCGFHQDYPKNSKNLKELTAKYGALVTEYPPDYPPTAYTFPVRNRIISGLSNGVVVVEGDEHSGSLITAGHALAQGRDVFSVPGRIDDPNSRGTNKLLKQGAKIVTCAADILEDYLYTYPALERFVTAHHMSLPTYSGKGEATEPPDEEKPTEKATVKKRRKPAPEYFSPTQLAVYRAVDDQPHLLQEIAERAAKPISDVLAALTELEIYGFVRAHGGRRFSL